MRTLRVRRSAQWRRADLWLKEGFARFTEFEVVDALMPHWDIMSVFKSQVRSYALDADAQLHSVGAQPSHCVASTTTLTAARAVSTRSRSTCTRATKSAQSLARSPVRCAAAVTCARVEPTARRSPDAKGACVVRMIAQCALDAWDARAAPLTASPRAVSSAQRRFTTRRDVL